MNDPKTPGPGSPWDQHESPDCHPHHHGRGRWRHHDFGHSPSGRGWRGFFARHWAMRKWHAMAAAGFPGGGFGGHEKSPFSRDCGRPTEFFDEESHVDGAGGVHPMMRGRGGRGGGFGPFGGGFGGGPRGFGEGRGRHGRRPFEQGDLRWLVLDLIAAQPRHGYEIIKAIEDALNGHYSPSPGVIYPTLTLLEETGLISGEVQGAKKLYSITDAGRTELEAQAEVIQAVRSRLKGAQAEYGGEPAPEIMRAIGNFRSALQIRLAKGQMTPETVSAITAAIDRAAGEIERL